MGDGQATPQPFLKHKVIEIGGWDMDADETKDISSGLSDSSKIRCIDGLIQSDDGGTASPLHTTILGLGSQSSAVVIDFNGVGVDDIRIMRVGSGLFDSTDYNDDTINRGWVIIWYV